MHQYIFKMEAKLAFPIPDYPDYTLAEDGTVYNTVTNRNMMITANSNGYPSVTIKNTKGVRKERPIHILLATMFIPNPDGLPIVDHINRNILDFRIRNLRWASLSTNRNNRSSHQTRGCAVLQYTLDDVFVARHLSYSAAARSVLSPPWSIRYTCKKKQPIHKGYKWIIDTPTLLLTGETWKPIKRFAKNSYYVSDLGRVKKENRILHAQLSASGYFRVTLNCEDGKCHRFSVHKLVMEAFIGPAATGMQVNHKNKIRSDNSLSNLEYVTRSENILHAHANGTCKHTWAEISSKRVVKCDLDGNLLDTFPSISSASKIIGCGLATVSRMCNGMTIKPRKGTNGVLYTLSFE